ncbi:MAG: hypothetical protein EZS28_029356 [Streblomastix strix]|uniref:Uncharacterized protein n=1 Tax=Streblomastix strix TaxID=222440 RepID=A0A5J4UY07_9EUKA|nr:MAG: hypothetical protein EZS28_029356 [Streblomastix strix]
MDRRLCDQIEQESQSVLQPITRQRSFGGQLVQPDMDELELISASANREDTKTIAKVKKDMAQAAIVVPMWRGQLWTNLLNRMSVRKVDLGLTEQILEPGKLMIDNPLVYLSSRKMEAQLVISTARAKISSGQWRGRCGFGKCFDVESCKRGDKDEKIFEEDKNPCKYCTCDVCEKSKCFIIADCGGSGEEFGTGMKQKCKIPNCEEYRQCPYAMDNGIDRGVFGMENNEIDCNEEVEHQINGGQDNHTYKDKEGQEGQGVQYQVVKER